MIITPFFLHKPKHINIYRHVSRVELAERTIAFPKSTDVGVGVRSRKEEIRRRRQAALEQFKNLQS